MRHSTSTRCARESRKLSSSWDSQTSPWSGSPRRQEQSSASTCLLKLWQDHLESRTTSRARTVSRSGTRARKRRKDRNGAMVLQQDLFCGQDLPWEASQLFLRDDRWPRKLRSFPSSADLRHSNVATGPFSPVCFWNSALVPCSVVCGSRWLQNPSKHLCSPALKLHRD